MESSRNQHDAEIKKLRSDNEQKVAMKRHQFQSEKQRCIDEHDAGLEDAKKDEELDIERIRVLHEREMNAMHEEYSGKTAQRQRSCEEEDSQWKIRREAELNEDEKRKMEGEHAKMKNKIQSDIDLAKQKLREEKIEKRRRIKMDLAEKEMTVKEAYDAEIQSLERKIEQATKESFALRREETDKSCGINEMQTRLENKQRKKFAEEARTIDEVKLAKLERDLGQQAADIRQDGERKVAQARNEKENLEKTLGNLIASYPKQQDEWAKEIESLKANSEDEIALAEMKVRAMIENKTDQLKNASAKLFGLREVTTDIEKQIDDARKIKLLGKGTKP